MSAHVRPAAPKPRKKPKTSARVMALEIIDTRVVAVEAAEPIDLQPQIAEAAYYFAEQRGFEPGHEVADWLMAEARITSRVSRSSLS